MKSYRTVLSIGFFLIVGASCTYQRPLLSIHKSTKVIVDSITKHSIKEKNYRYINLKASTVNISGYFNVIELDSLGNKFKIMKIRISPLQHMDDGWVRRSVKVLYYSSDGKIEKISKRIVQNHGISGTSRNKMIYFENGKRVKSVNE